MSCDSRNLIYVVKCSTCKEEYIGETGIGESSATYSVTSIQKVKGGKAPTDL